MGKSCFHMSGAGCGFCLFLVLCLLLCGCAGPAEQSPNERARARADRILDCVVAGDADGLGGAAVELDS